MSKIIEMFALFQMNKCLLDNNLYPDSQYVYRKAHSSETALIKFVDGIGSRLDDKLEEALLLIDLSNAFETVDNQILLNR